MLAVLIMALTEDFAMLASSWSMFTLKLVKPSSDLGNTIEDGCRKADGRAICVGGIFCWSGRAHYHRKNTGQRCGAR